MVEPPPLVRPVPGPVRAAFRYDRATPFAAGQRRGLTLAARPGDSVVAPCRGRVRFAGRTPRGGAVTIRCGSWAATVLDVTPTVRGGATVAAGRRVGRAPAQAVGLSLRPAGDRWGYVDPRPSLGRPRPTPPLGPAPRPRRAPTPRSRPARTPRAAPSGGRRRPAPIGLPTPLPVPTGAPPRPTAVPVDRPATDAVRPDPWVVAGGLALAALGLPALRRRRGASPSADGRAEAVGRVGTGTLHREWATPSRPRSSTSTPRRT